MYVPSLTADEQVFNVKSEKRRSSSTIAIVVAFMSAEHKEMTLSRHYGGS